MSCDHHNCQAVDNTITLFLADKNPLLSELAGQLDQSASQGSLKRQLKVTTKHSKVSLAPLPKHEKEKVLDLILLMILNNSVIFDEYFIIFLFSLFTFLTIFSFY